MANLTPGVKYEIWFEGNELKWSKQATQALGAVETKTKQLDSTTTGAFKSIGMSLSTLIAGAVSFAALQRVVSFASREFKEAEASSLLLSNAMSKVGGASAGSIRALTNQATALSTVTKYDDDLIIKAQALILRFSGSAEATKRLTEVTLDLSSALSIDLSQASMLIAKAMGGNTVLLGRYGITFTEAEDKVIKFGTANEKASLLVEKLGKIVGGMARDEGAGYGATMERMSNSLGNLAATVYSKGVPGMNALTNSIIRSATAWNDFLTGMSDANAKMAQPGASEMRQADVYYQAFARTQEKLNSQGGKGTFFGASREQLQSIIDENYSLYQQYYDLSLKRAQEYRSSMQDVSPATAGLDDPETPGAGGGGTAQEKMIRAEMQKPSADPQFLATMNNLNQLQATLAPLTAQMENLGPMLQDSFDTSQAIAYGSVISQIDGYLNSMVEQFSLINIAMSTMSQMTSTIGDGIASELVDGTYDWERAWKNVLKSTISMIVQMGIYWSLMIAGAVAYAAIMTKAAVASSVATGGISAGTGGIAAGMMGLFRHEGGDVPAYHTGGMPGLRPDERYIKAQTGEYVIQRSSVNSIGAANVAYMNKTGQVPGGSITVPITIHSTAQDGRRLAEELSPHIINIIRREKSRNVRI
jgi:hypothetical protein